MPEPSVTYPSTLPATQDVSSLQASVNRLNEVVEMLTGQRGKGASVQDGVALTMGRLSQVDERSANTAKRTLTLETSTGVAHGKLDDVYFATIDPANNDAHVYQLTTVTARSNEATAGGEIKLEATAGPAGTVATYAWKLTNGNKTLGMEANLKNDGTGAISWTAGQFAFRDGGTLKNVFAYDAGKFTLTGEVKVQGDLLVENSVGTFKVADDAITNAFAESEIVASGSSINFAFETAGGDVIIFASASNGYANYTVSQNGVSTLRTYTMYVDGIAVGAMQGYDVLTAILQVGSPPSQTYNFAAAPCPVSTSFVVTGLTPGTHGIEMGNPTAGDLAMSLVVVERKK